MTTHLLLVPKLRMRGAIPPLPHTPAWRGAWLSTGTTLPFLLIPPQHFVLRQPHLCSFPLLGLTISYINSNTPPFLIYRVLVGRSEGKRPLGRPRHRLEDNIKVDLREIGIDGANWVPLAQDRVQWRAFVNTVMNLRFP
jgi:hypothetical protein